MARIPAVLNFLSGQYRVSRKLPGKSMVSAVLERRHGADAAMRRHGG
jgi:hypothetical protein